jgi:hypothetical protein
LGVLRTSPKGKWHVSGPDTDRCPYVARVFGYHPADLPTQPVAVLGEYDWCSHCVHRVGLPGPAGTLYTVAGPIVAAAEWVTALEEQAPGMDWLEVARWTCRTPFGAPDPMPDLLAGLSGARGWARHRNTAGPVAHATAARRRGPGPRAGKRPGRLGCGSWPPAPVT